MKRLFIIIALSMLATLTTMADDHKQQRFNPEEFRVKLETFIAQKAELCPTECEKVFPIYREMKEKQRSLKQKEMQLKRPEKKYENEKDYQQALVDIAQLHVEAAKIEETYYKKMCKVIPAHKVYAITLAEDAFHRDVLRKFNNKPRK